MAERLTLRRGAPTVLFVTVPSSEDRVAVWVARSLGVLAMVLAGTAVTLPLATGLGYLDELMQTPEVVVGVSFSATGVLLVQNRRASRIGWLLLAMGVAQTPSRLARWLYLAAFVLIAFYREVPWLELLASTA